MTDDSTARWALPLLQPGQAQKEMVHNEAIVRLDLITQAVALAVLDTPPVSPEPGQAWIVGDAATGVWTGKSAQVAGWTAAGWRFVVPREGLTLWLVSEGLNARYGAGGWTSGAETAAHLSINGVQVVGPRRPAIPDPAAGSVIDIEARATLTGILAALRAHGLVEN